MKKNLLKVLVFLMAVAMVLPMLGCGAKKDELTTVTTKEEVRELTDTFYAGLAEANPVSMTSYYNGEKSSVIDIDGDKIHVVDETAGTSYYFFKENDKNWFINEGEQPVKEDMMYDLYRDSVKTNLAMFVTGYFDADTENTFTYSSTLSAKDETSTLTTDITGEVEGEKQTITVTGTKSDSKVRTIAVTQGEKELFRYEFAYDVTVDLPEYTLDDPTVFYKHVESPYANVSEVVTTLENDEDLNRVVVDGNALIFTEKDGRQLQLVAPLADQAEAFEALDVTEDDYQEKAIAIIKTLAVTDCVDFTDALVSEEELAKLVGQTVAKAIGAGYVENSWWTTGDFEAVAGLEKGGFVYRAVLSIPDDMDPESIEDFTDLNDAVIEEIRFQEPTLPLLPLD